MIDTLQEILATIRKNRLRTALTGFSIAWGIFMLIVLLAAGNGIQHGIMGNFASRATNTVEVWGGRVSIPHRGLPQGRSIRFDEDDISLARHHVANAGNISADLWAGGTASYGGEYVSCSMHGVYPGIRIIDNVQVAPGGRFINEMDMRERRKVAVINTRMKTTLFKPHEDPVGKYIAISGAMFRVVGVYEPQWGGNQNTAYTPFTTHQQLFNNGWGINSVGFTIDGLDTREANEAFTAELRRHYAQHHHTEPTDRRAIGIHNQMENYLQTLSIFSAISLFMWIIGIGTLMAGVVGVSNIMLITVRERTREFGIRKALGATPASILKLILLESIFITSIFGYVGMVLGIGLTELVNYALEASAGMGGGDTSRILKNPTVDLSIALSAMLVLVVAGTLAGYFPARKAIKITAVEAMRGE
jgi:putative ABC transport system permease protein